MIGNIFKTTAIKGKAIFNKNLYREMNEEIYESYLKSKMSKSMDTADTTFKTYKNNMRLFLNWFHERDKGYYLLDTKMLDEFPEIMDRYMVYCISERGNNKVTVNNKIVTMSSFYIWARRSRKAIFNPVLDIERQQKWKFDKRRNSYFLTVDEIKTCKEHMKNNPKKFDLRTRLIFSIFLDSAIRIGEMMRLKISNLKLEENCFKDIRQKGGETRDVIFTNETKELLIEYLAWRKKKGVTLDELLVTRYNRIYKQMSRETVRARVRDIGKIINIPDLYPHTLRKTTVNLVSQLAGIEKAALIAHHKNTNVTKDHYIKPLTEEEVRKQLDELNELIALKNQNIIISRSEVIEDVKNYV